MTISVFAANQISNSGVGLSWQADTVPSSGWDIELSVNGGAFKNRATVRGDARSFLDYISDSDALTPGDSLVYRLIDNDSPDWIGHWDYANTTADPADGEANHTAGSLLLARVDARGVNHLTDFASIGPGDSIYFGDVLFSVTSNTAEVYGQSVVVTPTTIFTGPIPDLLVRWWYVGSVVDISDTAPLVWRDIEAETFTFGPVDPLLTTPTYTTIERMKSRLGIDASDSTKDDELTSAALSAQIQINQRMGRSFPDTGTNPEIPGIPNPIKDLALAAAIRVYKRMDAPFGSAGSDALMGIISIDTELERAFRDDPLMLGYIVTRGVA